MAHVLQSSTPSRQSLCSLPQDILSLIFEILQAASPRSLSRLSLVNSQLHRLAQYSQHRDVHLQLLDDAFIERWRLIGSAGLEAAVRSLTIVDSRGGRNRLEPEYHRHIDMICGMVPRLTGLRTLTYTGNDTPTNILRALPSHVRLSAIFPGSMEGSPGEEQLLRLCGSVNLATLNVEFEWTWEPECRWIMTHLKRVLLACPNLKSLTLDVSQPRSGCVLYSQAQEYVGCGFEPGDRLPPLEELNLIKYEFGRAPQGTLPGGEIDFWVHAFDWSKLKTLKTGYEEFALKVASQLTALEEVHLLSSWHNQTMPEFLRQVGNSLRTISAPTLRQVSLEGLSRHSNTLETLHLHRDEDYGHTWMADCVDIDSLHRLRSDFPILRELTVDIARSGSWPLLTFDTLATFPCLRVLHIWFELGLRDFNHPISPLLTCDTAQYVCGYLQSRMPTLNTVHLHSGSPPSIGFGYPSVEAFWPSHNSTSFVCEVSQGSGNCQEDVVTVTCPILEQREREFRRWKLREKNTRRPIGAQIKDCLQKTFKPDTYRRKKAAEDAFTGIGTARRRRNEADRVAHEGPTPVSRWEGHYY